MMMIISGLYTCPFNWTKKKREREREREREGVICGGKTYEEGAAKNGTYLPSFSLKQF